MGTTAINLGQPKLMLDIWVAVVSCEIDRSINMQILSEGQRYERNGLFATPETIDDLTAQLHSPEQWVAYGLTTNFIHNEFNKGMDSIQQDAERLQEKIDIAGKKKWKLQDTLKKRDEKEKRMTQKGRNITKI